MSALGGYKHEFRWDLSEPNSVIVSGTFDEWKSTLHLSRGEDGKFAGSTVLPYGQKVLYKYIVDGNWTHNAMQACESDGSGNVNNVLHTPEAPEAKTEEPAAAAAAAPAETSSATPTSAESASSPSKKAEEEEDAGLLGSLAIAGSALIAGAGVAIHKAENAISHALEERDASQAHLGGPLAGDLKATAEGSTSPVAAASSEPLPAEAPADPAPTPAPAASSSEKAIPTVPSSEQLSDRLGTTSAAPVSSSVLPLVPEATSGQHPQALDTESKTTADSFVPVVPEPPATAPVSATGSQAAAAGTSDSRPSQNARTTSDHLAPALAYYPSTPPKTSKTNPVRAEPEMTTKQPESASTAPEVAVVPESKASVSPAAKPATTEAPAVPEKTATSAVPVSLPASGTGAAVPSDSGSAGAARPKAVPTLSKADKTPGLASMSSAEPAKADGPDNVLGGSTGAQATNKPPVVRGVSALESSAPNGASAPEAPSAASATTSAAPAPTASTAEKKDKYGSIGKAGNAPSAPTVTPSTPTKSQPNSANTTPTKGYVTAPTTPATADRKRKSSFFQKIKNSFSPNHKRESTA